MDFIERIFHLAPDGGTGGLELGMVLVAFSLALALLARRRGLPWSGKFCVTLKRGSALQSERVEE